MKRILTATILAACVALPLFAQDEGGDSQQPARRVRRGGEGGDGQPGGFGPGRSRDPAMWRARIGEWLADELQLDEAQRSQLEEISQQQREQMRGIGQRWAEVREAQDAGDEQKARELREQLTAEMRSRNPMTQTLDQLEPLLHEDQLDKLAEVRERVESEQQGREQLMRAGRELPDKLQLDDEQRETFDQLRREQFEQMRRRFGGAGDLMDQIREARESGDNDRAAALREQLEQQRPSSEAMLSDLLAKLEPTLRDEQKGLLEAYRDETGVLSASQAEEAASLRDILRAAKRVRLSREQKDQLREIEREALRALREARRDEQAKAALADSVEKRITKILDEAQAQKFHEQLERLNSHKQP